MRKVVRARTLLAIVGPVLLAMGALPARAQSAQPARALPDAVASGLNLFVSHRMTAGRLVIKVGTQAVLSAPFSAIKPGANGWFERLLSVESGRQTVMVQVIDGAGRLVAQQATEANLAAAGLVALAVAEHGGIGKGLTLEWRTP